MPIWRKEIENIDTFIYEKNLRINSCNNNNNNNNNNNSNSNNNNNNSNNNNN